MGVQAAAADPKLVDCGGKIAGWRGTELAVPSPGPAGARGRRPMRAAAGQAMRAMRIYSAKAPGPGEVIRAGDAPPSAADNMSRIGVMAGKYY